MNKLWATLLLSILIWMVHSGCQRRNLKQIAAHPTVKKKYRKTTQSISADFSYLACKSKLEYTDGRTQFSASATIRLKKDSIIWISITPMLGVEVLRSIIRTDSVFILNKIDKEYYAFSIQELSEKTHYPIDFHMAQAILLGNQPFSEMPEDSVISILDSLYDVVVQRRMPLYIENYIENNTKRMARLSIKELQKGDNMEINYENFVNVEGILFPFVNKISLNYLNRKGFQATYVAIEHAKVDPTEKDLRFPFSIPPKYVRKYRFE